MAEAVLAVPRRQDTGQTVVSRFQTRQTHTLTQPHLSTTDVSECNRMGTPQRDTRLGSRPDFRETRVARATRLPTHDKIRHAAHTRQSRTHLSRLGDICRYARTHCDLCVRAVRETSPNILLTQPAGHWRHPEQMACAISDVLLHRWPEDEPAKPLRLVEVELLSDRRPRSPVRVARGVSALVKVCRPHLVGK